MKAFRRILFWLHLVVGITVGLVVFIMSITGVALTYQRQTQQWADGFDVRRADEAVERMALAELLQQARDETGKDPTSILLRNDPDQPVRVSFGRERVEVNPYTGEHFGAGAAGLRGAFRTLIGWHRWLGQEGDGRAVARAITGFSNLAFLFIVFSGLYLWWPKSLSLSRLRSIIFFRRGLPTKARHFNWHNVMGFWTAVPLVIVVATGAFFSYSWPRALVYRITGEEQPVRGGDRTSPAEEKELPLDDFAELDAAVETALAQDPEWRLATVNFGPGREAPVSATLDRSRMGTRADLRTSWIVDRETGAVTPGEDPGAARKALTWVRWLHTGEAFGFIGQTIAGIASLAACFLVYTGWSLSWRRFLAWYRRRRAEGEPAVVADAPPATRPPDVGTASPFPQPASVLRARSLLPER